MPFHPRGVLPVAQAKHGGETEGADHADGDTLAMHQPRAIIVRQPLQRMAESVAKVEQRAVAGLGLVARHNRRLGGAAFADSLLPRRSAREHRPPVFLQPVEKIRVVNQPVFGNFRVAGAEFARRQGVEHAGVRQHQDGLVERADKILAMGGINAGLAADGRVNLRQQ